MIERRAGKLRPAGDGGTVSHPRRKVPMTEEDAFLRKLLEQPNSDLTRLVFADWLDEQGTPDSLAKAEFLRLIADADYIGKFEERVKELAAQLDPHWLAVVGKLPIENCATAEDMGIRATPRRLAFSFECPKKWEELTPTEDGTGVRYCGECEKTVHYCHDADDLRRNANRGNCVAVELGVPRRPGDLEQERFAVTTMGILYDPRPEGNEWAVEETPRRSWWARLMRRERRRDQG